MSLCQRYTQTCRGSHRPIADTSSKLQNQAMRLTWVLFWLFVLVSWGAVGSYVFFAGWSSCEVRGACGMDRFVSVLLWTLMPAQGLLAAYLKQRSAD